MKKLLSVISALFVGSLAFGQTTKADSTKITNARKVSPDDLKNMPADMGRDSLTQIDTASAVNRVKISDKQQKAVLDFVKGMPTQEPGIDSTAIQGISKEGSAKGDAWDGAKGQAKVGQKETTGARVQKTPKPPRPEENPKKKNKD